MLKKLVDISETTMKCTECLEKIGQRWVWVWLTNAWINTEHPSKESVNHPGRQGDKNEMIEAKRPCYMCQIMCDVTR